MTDFHTQVEHMLDVAERKIARDRQRLLNVENGLKSVLGRIQRGSTRNVELELKLLLGIVNEMLDEE